MRLNETHPWLAKLLSKVVKTKPRHNRLIDFFWCFFFNCSSCCSFSVKITKNVHNQTKSIKDIFCKKMWQYINTKFCFIRNYMVLLQCKSTSMFTHIKNILLYDNFILLSTVCTTYYDTRARPLADNSSQHSSFKIQT